MLNYILLLLLLLISIMLIKTTYKKKNKKQKESFATMDDVLDHHCAEQAPNGYNNYEGPWLNDKYYDPENTRCGRYACPKEKCYVLTRDVFAGTNNPHAYTFALSNSRMLWNEDSGRCISKHNPSSNIHCEPNPKPYCNNKSIFDIQAYYFNTDNNNWERRYVNEYMNSNGDCELRDTTTPFYKVNLMQDETTQYMNTPNAEKTYYLEKGPSCKLTFDNFKRCYVNESGDCVNVDNVGEYSSTHNAFRCDDGSLRYYGYSNTNGSSTPNGFECGWLDTECGGCRKSKHTCYVFDSNNREYTRKNFLNTFFDDDSVRSTPYACDKYLVVNESVNRQFDSPSFFNEFRTLEGDSQYLKDMFIDNRDGTIITYSNDHYDYDNTCKTDINPNMCSPQLHTCKISGYNLSNDEISLYRNQFYDTLGDEYDDKQNFYNVYYKRRFNSNGDACEYCKIANNNINEDCHVFADGTRVQSNPTCPDNSCPYGYELVDESYMFGPTYCSYCSNQYYDESTSNCKDMTGCPAGYSFDPMNNISDTFKVYNYQTKQEFDYSQNDLDTYDYTQVTFLDNNTDTQCTQCGSNEYMPFDNHLYQQCSSCEFIDQNIIYTVNDSKTSCDPCVIANKEYYGPTAKRVLYEGTQRVCSTCPSLDSSDDQKHMSSIVSITSDIENSDGKCYRRCNPGTYNNVIVTSQSDKEYDESTSSYPECDTQCTINHYTNLSTNQCEPCSTGTENLDDPDATQCTPCGSGYYNDETGSYCKSCPTGSGHMSGQEITSPNASSSVNNCQIKCIPVNENDDATYVSFSGRSYNTSTCPTEDCILGYDRIPLITSGFTSGYKLEEVSGTVNYSGDRMCIGPSVDTTNNECDYVTPALYGNQTYCCTSPTSLNPSTGQCECRQTPGHLESEYTWNGSMCEKNCSTSPNVQKINGMCTLVCPRGTYQSTDRTSCTDCPTSPNAISMTTSRTNADSESECIVAQCNASYRISRDRKSCEEITNDCDIYTETTHHTTDVHNLQTDASSITAYEIETEQKTSSDCDALGGSPCSSSEIDLGFGNVVGCCPTDSFYAPVYRYNMMSSSGYITNTRSATNVKKYCCSNGTQHKVALSHHVMYYGCCPPGETLYVNNNQSDCCPESTMTTMYYLNDAGECSNVCKSGYTKVGDVCTALHNCDSYWTSNNSKKDSNGYVRYDRIPGTQSLTCDYDNSVEIPYGEKNCTGDSTSESPVYCCDKPNTYNSIQGYCEKECEYNEWNLSSSDDDQLVYTSSKSTSDVKFDATCPSGDDTFSCEVGYEQITSTSSTIVCSEIDPTTCYVPVVDLTADVSLTSKHEVTSTTTCVAPNTTSISCPTILGTYIDKNHEPEKTYKICCGDGYRFNQENTSCDIIPQVDCYSNDNTFANGNQFTSIRTYDDACPNTNDQGDTLYSDSNINNECREIGGIDTSSYTIGEITTKVKTCCKSGYYFVSSYDTTSYGTCEVNSCPTRSTPYVSDLSSDTPDMCKCDSNIIEVIDSWYSSSSTNAMRIFTYSNNDHINSNINESLECPSNIIDYDSTLESTTITIEGISYKCIESNNCILCCPGINPPVQHDGVYTCDPQPIWQQTDVFKGYIQDDAITNYHKIDYYVVNGGSGD